MIDLKQCIEDIKKEYGKTVTEAQLMVAKNDIENDIKVHFTNLGKKPSYKYITYIAVTHIELYKRLGIIQ
jgi:hypothetical protein